MRIRAGTASTGFTRTLPGNGYRVSPKRVRRLARAAGLDACTRGRTRPRRCRIRRTLAAWSTWLAATLYRGEGPAVVRGYHVHFHDERLGLPGHGIDGYSRKVVGWSVADHMREELVIDAFRMAVANRLPGTGEVVFHSDRGSQYTGRAFRDVCLGNGIIPSVGILEHALTMRRRSRGTRRSRKSSSTCMHGRTSMPAGRPTVQREVPDLPLPANGAARTAGRSTRRTVSGADRRG